MLNMVVNAIHYVWNYHEWDRQHGRVRKRYPDQDYSWVSLVDNDRSSISPLSLRGRDSAEARLAAKRQARAEAREIRMRELERQQREAEENVDKIYDIYNTSDALNRSSRVAASVASPRSSSVLSGGNNSYHSSRRSSEDSLEEVASLRDIKQELKEVEEKFRKAMIANAQLDNEKAAAAYQLELYKDRLEELDEQHSQLQREHREKCRQFEALKRAAVKLQEDLEFTRAQLEERDRLIEEQGLVIVGGEYSTSEDENSDNDQNCVTNNNNSKTKTNSKRPPKRALVSAQVASALQNVGEGSLDVRLKKFVEHRNELLDELSRIKLELEEERARNRGQRNSTLNGPSDDFEDIQREANKLLGDYKFKLQKAEQDVSTLQANVARLESQVVRYKSAAEAAEKVEDDLKVEKRKLQRELRESQARVEELETAHSHLQRRLDKLKNAKSALLKDL
ncbi:leucine-rich repeat flightless-interacting protein 2-like isoform X2 [Lycorma delicatula]|uniref:leucine-rich repeat flightless-interacting protein 2-like isoform X2 n=1 Tax=Lycorma delicatula TaxID=130591 RepID=UPI003F512780